ncbi:MAG: hypothetical protein KDK40_02775 [Chlamydiia bacterium]|nr:hypothetical protein [Chlamydiia bacterium]
MKTEVVGQNSKEAFWTNYLSAAGQGLGRTFCLMPFIHPLDSIKYQIQCSEGDPKIVRFVRELMLREGLPGLYEGYWSNLKRSCTKQLWKWPIFVCVPEYLEKRGWDGYSSRVFAGVFSGTVDALFTTGLTRDAIQEMTRRSTDLNRDAILEMTRRNTERNELLKGVYLNWKLHTVGATVFLTSQKAFKEGYLSYTEKRELGSRDYFCIGLLSAGVVSVSRIFLDVKNTLFFTAGPSMHSRGWRCYVATAGIHYVISVLHNATAAAAFDQFQERSTFNSV